MVFVGLIRGINVGGHRRVLMASLRECLSLDEVDAIDTYVQSGNLVLKSQTKDTDSLSAKLEQAMQRCFGIELPLILMPLSSFQKSVRDNPFYTDDPEGQKQLYYIFYKWPPQPELEPRLRNRNFPNESWALGAKCLYLQCRQGYGTAKLTNNVVEKLGEMPATARNHRTVIQLLQMGEAIS
jgi:uncharacterized protein (DUF1697 family)